MGAGSLIDDIGLKRILRPVPRHPRALQPGVQGAGWSQSRRDPEPGDAIATGDHGKVPTGQDAPVGPVEVGRGLIAPPCFGSWASPSLRWFSDRLRSSPSVLHGGSEQGPLSSASLSKRSSTAASTSASNLRPNQ